MRRTFRVSVVGLVLLALPQAASALFHLSLIDEVMTSYGGDPTVQFVEIRMLAGIQNFVAHSVFAAFDNQGAYIGDILVVPANVDNPDVGVRWLIGTAAFQTATGLAPDFVMPAGILPSGGGMVCFGGGGGISPANPPSWDRTKFSTYVDCVAYGDYSGPSNVKIGTATSLTGDGHSLQRTTNTSNNAKDFTCADPATPQNNAGATASMPATSPCPAGEATATPTDTSVATPTATPTASPTPTATLPVGGVCVGDCNGNGSVAINELVLGVNIALGLASVDACPTFACQGADVAINCLVQGVNNALNGCPTPAPTATKTVASVPGALGVRRFSIDPASSKFIAVLSSNFNVPTSGFEGFLELTAGVPDPVTGLASIDVTDASDYLSVYVPTGGVAVCVKVLRDQLPVHQAGVIACNGGYPLGLQTSQDHNIGVVGTCSGGGAACTSGADCGDGTCFSADACAVAGGTVEGANRPHPGVCNGPIAGQLDPEISPPGTVLISPDPVNGFTKGLPVQVLQEHALPCGDENVTGLTTSIAFTTGHAVGTVLDYNNQPGMLSADVIGVPFSCDAWTQEDGPGTLVLSVANLDTPVPPASVTDIITQFVLAD